MINHFKLIRNIGQFANCDSGANLRLERLTLIYAENGRGKTTLADILRSLAANSPEPINDRKRVGSKDVPHVAIALAEQSQDVVFKDGTWNRSLTSVAIFDDKFVEDNLYSGLSISPSQRQNLHNIILGSEAVKLQKDLDNKIGMIEERNKNIRIISESELAPFLKDHMTPETFCALEQDADIERKVEEAEQLLKAARQDSTIRATPPLAVVTMPDIDLEAIERLLQVDLDNIEAEALARVQNHIGSMSGNSEAWIADGLKYVEEQDASNTVCPFCSQNLAGITLIDHYRSYFGDSYRQLKESVDIALTGIRNSHGDAMLIKMEQDIGKIREQWNFWAQYCNLNSFTLETQSIFEKLMAMRQAIEALLTAKNNSPLDKMDVPTDVRQLARAYEAEMEKLNLTMKAVRDANRIIGELKAKVSDANIALLEQEINRLELIRKRHEHDVSKICTKYLEESAAKASLEKERDDIRKQLNDHRDTVFPLYQDAVNEYLRKFGAGFMLEDMKPANIRQGSTATYGAKIDETVISIAGTRFGEILPFGSVLSAGDRTTLAFAFFMAWLDRNSSLTETVVVIDDPMSSMDSGRSLTTAQTIRDLRNRANQVIVLSHDKRFLCTVAEHTGESERASVEIVSRGDSSALAFWDLSAESTTEHDQRHQSFRTYLQTGSGDKRGMARNLRQHLEGYLRTACPEHFQPGATLGQKFVGVCRTKLGGPEEILNEAKMKELEDILEYAQKFHHDTNPNWEREDINGVELETFVRRTLDFVTP